MKDNRLSVLGALNLIKGEGDREPASGAARRELADAQASQRRLDAPGQGVSDEESPEDEEEGATPEQIMSEAMEAEVDHLRAENERLLAENKRLRAANIALNARLVAASRDRDAPST